MDTLKKLESVEKKLLDLGKRNKLINYRFVISSNISFLNDDFYDLYNKILDTPQQIAFLFDDTDEFEEEVQKNVIKGTNNHIYARKDIYTKEEIKELINTSKTKKTNIIYPTTITSKLISTIRNLSKKANTFFEENGINVLYLAFGFLKWHDALDNTNYLSPLCLLPVTIINKNINDKFYIKAIDEDFEINHTLIHKLKIENKIDLSNLKYDSIEDYINKISLELSKYDFEIVKDIELGLFSFQKIKMYEDINTNKEIYKNNNILKKLCEPDYELNKMSLEDIIKINDKKENDLNVVDSDFSQSLAIKAAKNGLSFVLQGPPGCGKSQTITNMIAQLIAQNKKVLFVCEKKAALDVVYKNLARQNLESYALAIYDPKLSKKIVIEDIYKNLIDYQSNDIRLNKKALEVFETLDLLDYKLNEYNNVLNKEYKPLNETLKEALDNYIKYIDYPSINYNFNINELTKEHYEKNINCLKKYHNLLKNIDTSLEDHLFYGLTIVEITLSKQNEFKLYIEKISNVLNNNDFNLSLKADNHFTIDSINELKYINKFYSVLNVLCKLPITYFDYQNLDDRLNSVNELEELFNNLNNLSDSKLNKYIKYLNLEDLMKIKDSLIKKNGILKYFSKEYKFAKKKLNESLDKGYKVKNKDIEVDILNMIKYQELASNIASKEVFLRIEFKDYYNNSKTDFKYLIKIINCLKIFKDVKEGLMHKDINYSLCINDYKNITYKSFVDDQYIRLLNLEVKIKELFGNLDEYFDLKLIDFKKMDFIELNLKLKLMLKNINQIYGYIDIMNARNDIELISPGLIFALKEYDSKDYDYLYRKNYYSFFIDNILNNDKILYKFNSLEHFESKNEYKKLIKLSYELAKTKISDLIKDSWPKINGIMKNNKEVSILMQEANKKRKLMPLNNLFKSIPNLLTDIKPCFMASPSSVSTYLDPNVYEFDVVIFDEASQLTTFNAINSIVRSKSMIVVGDNEQLPPTSFFDNASIDMEDLEYDIYDSILDESLAVLPRIMLKYHYRSKDESLIRFSNEFIYKDLYTFKEAYSKNINNGVKFYYVNESKYVNDHKINYMEALKVVDLVFLHFKETPFKSLGVVTFNLNLQKIIEKLIMKRRKENHNYEEFFNDTMLDSFFVKNLETVQGDERDVIILCVGYTKNESNKLSMNFGPINREGGYKRLNVAITRAKECVKLVSSILPTDFDLSKTDSRGVRMLYDYLTYASSNKENILSENINTLYIQKDIQNELLKRGYKTDLSVGTSKLKIDVAIKNEINPDIYDLGIVIDILSYSNEFDTNNREYLFENVFSNRGWKLYYIYAFAYIKNKEQEILNIIKYMTKEKKNVNTNIYEENNYIEEKVKEDLKIEDLFLPYPNENQYINYLLKENLSNEEIIIKLLDKVCPINYELLKKCLLPLYNVSKMTSIISKQIDNDINNLITRKRYYKVIGFILRKDDLFNTKFRRHDKNDAEIRSIENIYIEELQTGIYEILNYVKEMDINVLYQTLNKLLGYQKITQNIKFVYNNAIKQLHEQNKIKFDDVTLTFLG